MNEQYELFRNDDGRVLERLYGKSNAIGRAKSYAQSLNMTIGLWTTDQRVEFFQPEISLAWIPPVTQKKTLKPMPCTRCNYKSDGTDWLDEEATCPKCKLVQGF